MEKPEQWVLLKIGDDLYKVFATWRGGYTGSDTWRLNSGVQAVTIKDDSIHFQGFSGSEYICAYSPASYMVGGTYLNGILNKILDSSTSISLVDYDDLEDIINQFA